VKRKAILALTVVAVGVAAYVGNTLRANPGAPAPAGAPAPRPRIALINLSHVVKSYKKFNTYSNELKVAVEPFRKREEALKKRGEELVKESQKPGVTPERKEAIEKEGMKLKRDMEDLRNEFGQFMAKKQGQQFVTLYGDVRNACERYAVSHSYDMVLHYNDAPNSNPAEYWSEANVARKFQAGALIPIFYKSGVDVSEDIIKMLNDSMGTTAVTPGVAPKR
jgi:Skp family chaperone for outer membrane proteins